MHQDDLGTITHLHKQEILEIRDKLEAECSGNETLKRELFEAKQRLYEKTEKIHVLEQEIKRHKKECSDMEDIYRDEVSEMKQKIDAEHAKSEQRQEKLKALEKTTSEQDKKIEARDQTEIVELRKKLEEQIYHQGNLEKKLRTLQSKKEEALVLKEKCHEEIKNMRKKLEEEQKRNGMLEDEVNILKEQILHLSCDLNESTNSVRKGNSGNFSFVSESPMTFSKSIQIRDTISCQRATIAKLLGEVGLPKIVSYMELEDKDVQIHAVKVLANLAAEESNQEKIVEAGGLSSLLMLLETTEDETIQRVAAGAIANLAMNAEKNQELIMMKGGVKLLAKIANKAEDPQTLQMVGGALANLCGNEKLQMRLRDEGGIKALIGMVRSGHSDVLAQVARGVANFAKCESRGATQGHRKGRSFLIDDGALPWIVANSNNEAIPVTRHVELALCHLSSHEANAKDIVSFGAFWELVRISRECSREDIRNLAKRAINTSPTFQMELRRVHFPRG
ncbi:kinesin-like protein KIN-UB isoform X1 [Cryptomeria japonica]|uniref:kinesin-like protein KIN-UB isoform X1 n=2 Tax=Cryptomeria japonica TaxID=3369 RepID=UPI0027D9E109|nr:kinesin-like protein KIN-UB isoform X1 [Cryptomeria japonica]